LRAQINLASEPFRRDRVFLVSSFAMAVALLVLLLALSGYALNDRRRMQASLTQLDSLGRQLAKINAQQAKLDTSLLQSGNADVLDRSQFINKLLYRKGISWTRLFADLEKVVPPDVSIISIRPQADSQNHIFLDIVAGAKTQKPFIDLLLKFEASDLFGSTSVYGIIPPSQTDPLFRYRLSVNYAQKL
jgi:type IV pilus assembly protein PilN